MSARLREKEKDSSSTSFARSRLIDQRFRYFSVLMKQFLVFFWLCCATLSAVAQSTNRSVVATIDGRPISREEFVYAYQKNKMLSGQVSLAPRDYLNLYLDYLLKVADAQAAGLDTSKSFRKEFRLYRDSQLAKRLVNPTFIDSVAKVAYQKEEQQLNGKDKLELSHILLAVPSTATASQREAISQRADSIYQLILSGTDFSLLAQKYSEDQGTAHNGGRLPTIYPGMTELAFEEAAYRLGVNQVSRPVLSSYGYHIILMRNRQHLPPFAEVYPSIVENLRKNDIEEMAAQQSLALIQQKTGQSRASTMDSLARTLSIEDKTLALLLQEYHDGLLVYEISKQKVWDAAEKAPIALAEVFKRNRKSLKWSQPRFVGYIVGAQTKALAKQAKKLLRKGVPANMEIRDYLASTLNKDSVVAMAKGRYIVQKGENSTIDNLAFGVKTARVFLLHENMPFTMLSGRIEKRPQSYEDARSEVLELRQKELEALWLEQLRRTHRITINEDVVKTIPLAQ